jgi:hypothetical protein
VIGDDFDLTNHKFSYTSLKELGTKVPNFLLRLYERFNFVTNSWVGLFFKLVEEFETNHANRR